MKSLKVATTVLILAAIAALSFGCSSGSNAAATARTMTATVNKGNVSVSITGTGNLAYSQAENLAFEMAGTVQEVLVEEGDSVEEGEELAGLDTTEWGEQIKTLEKQLVSAERALAGAERQISANELAVSQAKLDLQTAEDSVADIPAVKAAQDMVDLAEASLKGAQAMYGTNPSVTSVQLQAIQQQLTDAKQNLQTVLAGTGFSLTS